ncbi:AIM24 family protein [Kytococcus sp. Marseille-QA3725]
MALYGKLFEQFEEVSGNDQFQLQNKKLLKIRMQYGPVSALTGSMVAYQGDIRFKNKGSGGLGKMFKQAVSGEGVDMMEAEGTGELFVANMASEIQVLYMENDELSLNGQNVLAFSSSIDWDIHRIEARGAAMTGGLYNVGLRGTGYVAFTTKGDPVALDVSGGNTFVDPQAAVMWTRGARMDVRVDTGGLGSMLRGGTGETFQMAFSGQGHVVVQPAENVAHTSQGGSSGLGQLFN